MKYLSEQTWAKLSTNDFRSRFFVEAFVEKLSMYTPHFHQSRLLNVFSACREMHVYVDEYRSNKNNASYVSLGIDEIESCLSTDVVAKTIFARFEESRENLFKRIHSGDLCSLNLNRLSFICRSILTDEDKYQDQLLMELKASIFDSTDLTKKSRITSLISDLTGLYVTNLLNKGYSPTYLYNRVDMFTRANNYSGRTFQQQFDLVTEKLRSHTTSFDIYFAIHASKLGAFSVIPGDTSFEFMTSIPECINGTNLEKLKKHFEPNLIAKISLSSTDYVTASWGGKENLDKVLDAATALELNPRVRVSSHCVAISKNSILTHTKSLNIGLLTAFLASENGTHLSNADTSIRHANIKLNDMGKEHLGRSLRYLRLARESTSLEQKLLNLWIALESLFSDGDASIIANITNFVPQFYSVTGLARRVIYIRGLLVKNSVPVTPIFSKLIDSKSIYFDDKISLSQVFLLLRNNDASIELFKSLGPMEHLKFRLISIFEEIKDNKSISRRISRSEKDVIRQLRRIYFLRNKIAHTGRYENIRPQLITHLIDYLVVCYMAISEAAAVVNDANAYSIGELLDAYKMGTELVVNRSNSSISISDWTEILPSSVI